MSAILPSGPRVPARDDDGTRDFYARARDRSRRLDPAHEQRLARRARRGDLEAKNELIEAHLRLVIALARRYVGHGLALADLVQEGAIGLIRAAEKFDPERGTKFSTYATWWIRQAITRALADKARTIRLPVPVVDKLQRLRRAESALTAQLGRLPSVEELSPLAGVSPTEIERLRSVAEAASSLDSPFPDSTATRAEMVADIAAAAPFDAVDADELDVDPRLLMGLLSTVERRVVELRLGLRGEPHTRSAIAALLGLTPARVRRIEDDALARLRRALRQSPGFAAA